MEDNADESTFKSSSTATSVVVATLLTKTLMLRCKPSTHPNNENVNLWSWKYCFWKSNQGNQDSGNQKNVIHRQRPDMKNRHTQQRT